MANNWVVGNTIAGKGLYTQGISLSRRLQQDAAAGNVFFENQVSTQLNAWSGGYAVGNAVLTSTIGTDRDSFPAGQNNTFLADPELLI